jgi:DNA-binding LytR/AlgR family response regulator
LKKVNCAKVTTRGNYKSVFGYLPRAQYLGAAFKKTPMQVIIVEDEALAAETLIRQIGRYDTNIQVKTVLDTVRGTVAWLQENPAPDLAFFDIHLADGLSFDIFEQVKITFPVVFTTAYDAYALRAFKVSSVDYLLKPVAEEDLRLAFAKLHTLRGAAPALPFDPGLLRQWLLQEKPAYKTRFMVKIGDKLLPVEATEVAFFYGENKMVWLRQFNGRKYPLDYSLDELEALLDPAQFYRLNRQYIVCFKAVKEAVAYSNSRLKVLLRDAPEHDDVVVSREKAEAFRLWMGK